MACDYLSMLELRLNYVSKKEPTAECDQDKNQ